MNLKKKLFWRNKVQKSNYIISSGRLGTCSTVSSAVTAALPAQLIALSSPLGNKLFSRSYSPDYFWRLNLQFITQKNLTHCSIASSVMVLNALAIPAPSNPTHASFAIFTQDNFFTPTVAKILPSALVKNRAPLLTKLVVL